jgi:hypothetical protein
MIVPRFADVVAVAAVAIVVLMPSGSLTAKPALVGDRMELDRVATLEDARFAQPDSVDAALALGDAYLRSDHPDWALATTAAFADAGDHRVHLLRATAWADRMQPTESVAESARGVAACDQEGPTRCDLAARTRLGLVAVPMQALVDAHIDPRKDPRGARDTVGAVMHSTRAREIGKHQETSAKQK